MSDGIYNTIFELHLCTVVCVPMLPTERLKATRLITDLVHCVYVREVSTRCFSGWRKVLIGAVYGYHNFLSPGRHKPQSLYRLNLIGCIFHVQRISAEPVSAHDEYKKLSMGFTTNFGYRVLLNKKMRVRHARVVCRLPRTFCDERAPYVKHVPFTSVCVNKW